MIDFIQIGANLGNNPYDIIWTLSREKKWSGLLVEPLPTVFEKLKENYSDVENLFFEQVAITSYNGFTPLYYSPEFVNEGQQASVLPSMSLQNSDSRSHDGRRVAPVPLNSAIMYVRCYKLESLVDAYEMTGKEFELLQIDAEGLDGAIIQCTDFNLARPKYIRYESCHLEHLSAVHDYLSPNDAVLQYLAQFGYKEIPDMYAHLFPQEGAIDTMVMRCE